MLQCVKSVPSCHLQCDHSRSRSSPAKPSDACLKDERICTSNMNLTYEHGTIFYYTGHASGHTAKAKWR